MTPPFCRRPIPRGPSRKVEREGACDGGLSTTGGVWMAGTTAMISLCAWWVSFARGTDAPGSAAVCRSREADYLRGIQGHRVP